MSRTGPTGGGPPTTAVYRNPFRKASVTPERIDMGVDYSGRPGDPIYALGSGTVIETFPFGDSTGSGWPGGGWVSYRLDDGPAKGQVVYVAEGVQPAVTAGQHVTPNTVVAHFTQSTTGIETGFANAGPGTGTLAAEQHEIPTGGDPGGWTTLAGAEFANLLAATGAPAGKPQGAVHGPGGGIVSGFKFGKGGPTGGTTLPGVGSGLSGDMSANCLVKVPGFKVFAFFGPSVGGGCVLSKSQARAGIGAGLLLIGGGLFLIGTLILAGYGLKGTGAGQKAAGAVEAAGGVVALVPGGEAAGAAIASGGRAARQRGTANRVKAATGVVRQQRAREAREREAQLAPKRQAAARQQQAIRRSSKPAPKPKAAAKKGP